MNLKSSNVKKLIVLGSMLITVSFLGINGAVMKKKSDANSSFFHRTDKTETFLSNERDGFMQEKQTDRLYVPPPDGGDPIGSETPVEGHEIVFFLWAFVGFVLIKLRNNKVAHH